ERDVEHAINIPRWRRETPMRGFQLVRRNPTKSRNRKVGGPQDIETVGRPLADILAKHARWSDPRMNTGSPTGIYAKLLIAGRIPMPRRECAPATKGFSVARKPGMITRMREWADR